MVGKTVIITGCNTGIGKEVAMELARRGAKIYMACRNQKLSEQARQEIVRTTGNSNVIFIPCDLASLASVRSFVKEWVTLKHISWQYLTCMSLLLSRFLNLESRLHVLINNAGITFMPRTESKEGFEMHLATNHLGHFLLTNLLLDTLKSSAPSRIITVSSAAHRYGRINQLDLNMEKSYNEYQAYFQSKLANILFSRALAKRLAGTRVTSNSLHPGLIYTVGTRRFIPIMDIFIAPLFLFMKTLEQ